MLAGPIVYMSFVSYSQRILPVEDRFEILHQALYDPAFPHIPYSMPIRL